MSESWSRRADRSDHVEVGWFCPKQPYLEIQIPHEAVSVQRLVITTVSHDQGFSDSEASHGTYNDSYSFFEVTIITSELHERAVSKRFQSNLHASREARKHVNVWDVRQELTEEKREWIASFRAGDYIQVIPEAEFIGWTNSVYEVSIEIEGERQIPALNALTLGDNYTSLYYQPLDRSKREVRMLLLHPGADEEPISCNISAVSLDDLKNPYVALSYCWGDPGRRETIHVRDVNTPKADVHDLKINDNLFQALLHLRAGIKEPFWLWADAVCINQDDLDERSHQVTLIQTIYKQADRVTVWLGLSNDVRKTSFARIREVEDRFQWQLDRSKTYTPDELSRLSLDFWIKNISGHPCMEMTSEWRKCDFDWFNRTWVLQEIVNAKGATVRCGDDILSWSVISRFAEAIHDHKKRAPLIRYGIMPSIFLTMTKSDQTGKQKLDILEVLVQTLGLKASDQRDRIFAMLQFGDETRDLANVPISIQPDYGKSVQQVFTDFVRWWICEHKSLRILSMIHTLKGRSWQKMYYGRPTDLENLGYPSWSFWYGGHVSWATGTLALTPNSTYCAGGSSVPDAELILSQRALLNHEVLRVRGYRMCKVWTVSQYETGPKLHLEKWIISQHKAAHVNHNASGNNDNTTSGSQDGKENSNEVDEKFAEGGADGIKTTSKVQDSKKPLDDKEARLEDKQPNGDTSEGSDQVEADDSFPVNDVQATFENIFNPSGSARTWIWDKDDQIVQRMQLTKEVQMFYTHLKYHQDGFEGEKASFSCYSCCRMRAVNSSSKPFLGLVPHLARPGDVVVLLNGGSVFYLLRESRQDTSSKSNTHTNGVNENESEAKIEAGRKKWILVGECFLDDMMNGEALKEIEESGIAEEIFDLI